MAAELRLQLAEDRASTERFAVLTGQLRAEIVPLDLYHVAAAEFRFTCIT